MQRKEFPPSSGTAPNKPSEELDINTFNFNPGDPRFQEMMGKALRRLNQYNQVINERDEALADARFFKTVALVYEGINRTLSNTAFRDALTGVRNKRGLEQIGNEEQRSEKGGFALMFLDLNGFKQINDTYGHEAGDTVLRAFAEDLERRVRKEKDTVSRRGGDEFVVIFRGATPEEVAEKFPEGIRFDVEFKTADGQAVKKTMTASAGVAKVGEGQDLMKEIESAITRADAAMYEAKREFHANSVNRIAVDHALPERKEEPAA